MVDKDRIRPIYEELQGYLSQAPKDRKNPYIQDSHLWEKVNKAIDDLNSISGEDYDRFKLEHRQTIQGLPALLIDTYRGSLGALISKAHGTFFSDEQAPFSGMASTQINVAQEQSQSLQVEIVLEINTRIVEMLPKYEQGTPERKFLDKMKDSLRSVKSASGLITLILQTARDFGISLEELASMFS